MGDVAALAGRERPKLQRAEGAIALSVKRRGAASVVDNLRQAGCLKLRFPRGARGEWMEAVALNSSGGVAAGDRLSTSFACGEGTHAMLTAQAAERFYRAPPGSDPAVVRNRVRVTADARAEWLPQETILFDRCTMDRVLDVELAGTATFLGVETLVFGRAAMGETVSRAMIRDLIRVRRADRLLLHDALRLDGEVGAVLPRKAILGDARAIATVIHVATDAEARLEEVRKRLPVPLRAGGGGYGLEAAATAYDDLLLARFLARDSLTLRRALIAVLSVLRDSRPLPKVWTC
jgi:urease accessory protein